MADFCAQCSFELFGKEVPNDLSGLTGEENWKAGLAACVLCEGCGPIQVDPDGVCVSPDCIHEHGKKLDRDDVRRFHEMGE